ncbi:DUF6011 domain-containing protein [Spirosoma rhododendri]|uniref:Uncharacterized protein n=1 Tax=Spirosoma rhododendri TaxID=2728024 RepID=A0A7L5DU69_9BACT|nr:DUF6011 domain-containing protein [Spirosoma rhododendri]QJD79517.1 hypothetical protein HH216_14695 [Spirosoma rhododendri]
MKATGQSGPCCSVCGKPLTDPVSIEKGSGPECAGKQKRTELAYRTGNLFANRADYSWGLEGAVIWIEDNNGPKSVTNDMDAVLTDICHELREEVNYKLVMYRDSRGVWDAVSCNVQICESLGTFRQNGKGAIVSGVDFVSLNQTDRKRAKIELYSKAALRKVKPIRL